MTRSGQELVTQSAHRKHGAPFNLLGLSVSEMRQIGETLGQSGFFADVQDQAQAFAKILAGQELGVGPFEAMRGIDVIKGRLCMSAGLTAKLVKRSGRYHYRVTEASAERCVIEWFEGAPGAWEPVGESSFSLDEAKAAGLLRADGGWGKYPADMLFARALTRGARRYAADALGGAVYTPDELGALPTIDADPLVVSDPSPPPLVEPPPPVDGAGPGDDAGGGEARGLDVEATPIGHVARQLRGLDAEGRTRMREVCEQRGIAATVNTLAAYLYQAHGDRAVTSLDDVLQDEAVPF